jgi:hypothetical protein
MERPKAINERFPKMTWLVVTLASATMSGMIGWGMKKGLDYYFPAFLASTITQELHIPEKPLGGGQILVRSATVKNAVYSCSWET